MDKEEGIASRCKPEGSRDNGKMITSLLPLMSVLIIAILKRNKLTKIILTLSPFNIL